MVDQCRFHLNGNGLHEVLQYTSVMCLMFSGAFCCEYLTLRFKNLSVHSSVWEGPFWIGLR